MKTCPLTMHLHTILMHHLFIYTLPTHYTLEHALLHNPCME
jgi:hypothetical protein